MARVGSRPSTPFVSSRTQPRACKSILLTSASSLRRFESMRGGEFNGESATGLIDICRASNIKLTVVTPHEHQAHGIVERAHQTLLRQAHSMLLAADLDMSYWSYALRYAAYTDQFMSSHDGLPAPYSFLYPNMPMQPVLRALAFWSSSDLSPTRTPSSTQT